jgi:nitrate/TMAO reductase-like tetraheme cytochrome c subunit
MATEEPIPDPTGKPAGSTDPSSQADGTAAKPQYSPARASPNRPLWMRLLGWRHRQGWLPFAPTIWGGVLLVVLSFAGGSLGFFEYSMQPDFCRSCHLMEPYYQAWHKSTHKDVACTQCHFEPGLEKTLQGKFQASAQAVKFITGTYGSKPHAQIADASCMRQGCHERRLLEGKVNWEVSTVRGGKITIRFDHTAHLSELRRGKQLRCVSCHSQIVQGQHLVVTVDTCFLCHMKGFEHGRYEQTMGGCKACHDAPKQQIRLSTGLFNHSEYLDRGVTCENCHSDVISGDGAVTKQACWTCHNQEEQIAKFDEPTFLHKQHITLNKVECQNCHRQIIHSLDATLLDPVKPPTSSHNAMESGQCGSCHEMTHAGPAELYRGKGARGVGEMPSPMSRAQVDCIACHKVRQNQEGAATVVGQTFLAVQESCDKCHGTKYPGVLESWRKDINRQLKSAQTAYEFSRAAVDAAGLSSADKLLAERLLDDASYNIRLIRLGHGVHNVNYSTAALNYAIECCQQSLRGTGVAALPIAPTTQPATQPTTQPDWGGVP